MRNLKRALSLALASVMLLGLMVVGTGASYSDVTSKNNTEAIEVLQAVGIMTGDDKGNFNPDQNVTRNEMAVIMSNLMDYVAASYKGTAPFTDVPTWAEPYVAACYTNGIIAGTSKTTFGGANTVTAGQAALMLMKALGYFQYQSDFGDDWLVETVKQATKIDLFDGIETGATAALTRNQVAQLVLNALEADCVQSDGQGGVTVTGDGFSVTTGKATYSVRTGTATKYSKIDATKTDNKYFVQLGEDLYSGDLVKSTAGDDFGRPATTWKYKNSEVGTYSDAADYTYTGKVTKGTLYSDVGSTVINNINSDVTKADAPNGKYGVTVKVDGVTPTNGYTTDTLFKSNSSAGITDNKSGTAVALTDKGVLTEVYVDDDNYTITICIINTYLMQASSDYNSSKETLGVSVVEGAGISVTSLDLDDFDTLANYAEDDYILFTYSKATNEVKSIDKAETVTGNVSIVAGDAVTIDGTKYSYNMVAKADSSLLGTNSFTVDENAVIVVDAYGYLIYIDDASVATGNYIYVDSKGTDNMDKNAIAGAYTADGVYAEITVKKLKGTDVGGTGVNETTDATQINSKLTYAWYSYTKDSSGKYTLTVPKTADGQSYSIATTKVITNDKISFLNGETIRANSNTIFVVDDGSDVKVYTGISAVPSVTVATGKTVAVSYVKVNDDTNKGYASLVFVSADGSTLDDASSVEEVMYVLNEDSRYKDANDTVIVYNAIVNGELKTVKSVDGLDQYTMYYKVRTDSDGYVTSTSSDYFTVKGIAPDTDPLNSKYRVAALDNAKVEYDSGALTLGGNDFTVASDAQVVMILAGTKAADVKIGGGMTSIATAITTLGAGDLMKDEDAKQEVTVQMTAKGLGAALKNYAVDGVFFGVTSETDNTVLKTLYVVVTDDNIA